jgi:hypothetical protein
MTSHSSQGQTAGRVLVHVETDRAGEKLLNQRLAYVAVSRGQYDARIYTDDKVTLARALDRDVSHRSALEKRRVERSPRQGAENENTPERIGRSDHGRRSLMKPRCSAVSGVPFGGSAALDEKLAADRGLIRSVVGGRAVVGEGLSRDREQALC